MKQLDAYKKVQEAIEKAGKRTDLIVRSDKTIYQFNRLNSEKNKSVELEFAESKLDFVYFENENLLVTPTIPNTFCKGTGTLSTVTTCKFPVSVDIPATTICKVLERLPFPYIIPNWLKIDRLVCATIPNYLCSRELRRKDGKVSLVNLFYSTIEMTVGGNEFIYESKGNYLLAQWLDGNEQVPDTEYIRCYQVIEPIGKIIGYIIEGTEIFAVIENEKKLFIDGMPDARVEKESSVIKRSLVKINSFTYDLYPTFEKAKEDLPFYINKGE